MRIPKKNGSISVFAVAGACVVVLGFDATDAVLSPLNAARTGVSNPCHAPARTVSNATLTH